MVAEICGLVPEAVSPPSVFFLMFYTGPETLLGALFILMKHYNWTEIEAYFLKGHSIKECREKFGFNVSALYKARKRGDVTMRERYGSNAPVERWLRKDTLVHSSDLKKRLINSGKLLNICAICHQPPVHNGRPLTLQLDHINGIHNDNRIENLRILCPNCHTQTPTYGPKNKILLRDIV